MVTELVKSVSDFLGWDSSDVVNISRISPVRYKVYKVKKRKGGFRKIHHPWKLTKAIQHVLIHKIFEKLPIHNCAIAYRKGIKSPLLKNAKLHSDYKFTVKTDIRDFFPSITPKNLFYFLKKYSVIREGSDEEFITNVCFIGKFPHTKRLPIGAPSSPIISNIIMHEVDEKIFEYSKKNGGVYSRYADDLIFSSEQADDLKEFLNFLKKTLRKDPTLKLKINSKKTRFCMPGNRKIITGLFVSPKGQISIGRKQKRKIKSLINDFKYGKISEDDIKKVKGHLSFVMDTEPKFIYSLVYKYSAEVISQIWRV